MTKKEAIEEEMTMAGLGGQITTTLNISITQQKHKIKQPKIRLKENYKSTNSPNLLFTLKVTGSALGMTFIREYENLEAAYLNNVIDDTKMQFMGALRNHYFGLKLAATLPKTTSTPLTVSLENNFNYPTNLVGSPGI